LERRASRWSADLRAHASAAAQGAARPGARRHHYDPLTEQFRAAAFALPRGHHLLHYPGATVPHHVVIYLGGDRILQALGTGQNVGYGTVSEFPGQAATVRRITER
jgi:cell wall-associated NlpC family hydrolase